LVAELEPHFRSVRSVLNRLYRLIAPRPSDPPL
jgi:hypothetical protein